MAHHGAGLGTSLFAEPAQCEPGIEIARNSGSPAGSVKRFLLTAVLAAAVPSQTASAPATDNTTFEGSHLSRSISLEARLSSLNQNPPVNGRIATGTATLTIRLDRAGTATTSASIVVMLIVTSIMKEVVTAGRLHRGNAGINGPVVFDLRLADAEQSGNASRMIFNPITGQAAAIFNQFSITNASQIEALEEIVATPSAYYVNVHTESNPDGHVRGQLRACSDATD